MEVSPRNNFNFMKTSYILITGSSSGIGKEMAIYLSKANNIVLHGRDQERLVKVMSKCDTEFNHKIWTQDLSEIEDIEGSLSQFITSENIEIIGYVHCAGYMKMLPLKMSTAQILTATLNTNIISASLITKVLINKKLNSQALKSVVFLSSNLSNMGAKGMSSYGASKGAIDTLMRCLAVELAPMVRLNSILPGAIPTEMTQAIFNNEEVRTRMIQAYPLGIGEALDICYMAEFLLSTNSKWITGQQFTVDGGRSINISG
jgi:NAD(P)-dependent dehydrogenase (short-subunit alcohol dehydrogenase family)